MRSRQRITIVMVLAAIALLAAWGVAVADTGEQSAPVPCYTVADPRAGLLTLTDARADNLVRVPEEPLGVVDVDERFDVRVNCEAVFFAGSAGQARHEMAIYRMPESGEPVLLGSDNVAFATSGPKRKTKALVVRVHLQEEGEQQLRIVLKSSAKAAGMSAWVEDVDTFDVWVEVEDHVSPTVEEPTATPVLGQKPERSFLRGLNTSKQPDVNNPDPHPTPTPTQDSTDPEPLPLDRRIIVANPRGHLIDGAGYVDNFDQGHGRVLAVREGDSITFKSCYEFVWFDGPGGSAETELEIRMQELGVEDVLLGEGSVEKHGQQRGYRVAGNLVVDVPFPEAGEYALLVTVRTRVTPSDLAIAGAEDVDRIALLVRVLAEPEVGAISGIVMAENNEVPLEGVAVRIVRPLTWQGVKTVYTGPDGIYVATGLEPGQYLVHADPRGQNYLGEWWDDAPLRQDATRVPVVSGETTEEIDFALTPGAIISGRVVKDTDSVTPVEPEPIKGVLITIGDWETDTLVAKGITANDGTYLIDQLPAGRYWVHASGATKGLIAEYWDNHLVREDADQILLEAGEEAKNIDFALRYGGYIAGRVVGVTDAVRPVPFKVDAYDWTTGDLVQTANVGIGGRYWMSLPVGSYRVYAYDEDGQYRPEYYNDVTDPGDATRVEVTAQSWPHNIDFQLDPVGVALLQIDPVVSQVMPGDVFTVAVEVQDAIDLAAFSLEIGYDPQVVHAAGAELGDFLGSTGRSIVVVDPLIDNVAGLIAFGAASYGTEPGPDGQGMLAIITFEAQAAGSTGLDLLNTQLSDTNVVAIPHRSKDGRAIVGDCIFGDLDCDCDVDLADIMLVALRWGAEIGDPDYDPLYDLDGDGDIDIVDVALVASAWGNTCDDLTVTLQGLPMTAAGQMDWPPEAKEQSSLTTGLRLEPGEATVEVGDQQVVEVRIDEAQDLGGFEFVLEYDATQFSVDPASVVLGDLLGSTGRSVMPFQAEVEINGTVGSVSFGAISLGATPPGPSGAGLLASVTFVPLQPGLSQIQFRSAQVMNTLGQAQEPLALQGATMTVEATGLSFVPHIAR